MVLPVRPVSVLVAVSASGQARHWHRLAIALGREVPLGRGAIGRDLVDVHGDVGALLRDRDIALLRQWRRRGRFGGVERPVARPSGSGLGRGWSMPCRPSARRHRRWREGTILREQTCTHSLVGCAHITPELALRPAKGLPGQLMPTCYVVLDAEPARVGSPHADEGRPDVRLVGRSPRLRHRHAEREGREQQGERSHAG